jgi:tetratricopeptide (TPR) repeat protein
MKFSPSNLWQRWRRGRFYQRALSVGFLLLALWWGLTAWQDHRQRQAALHNPLALAEYAAHQSGDNNYGLLREIAVAYAQAGDFAHAHALLDDFPAASYGNLVFPGPRFYFRLEATFSLQEKALGLAALAGLYQQAGRRAEALATLATARDIAVSLENVYSSQEARESIMRQYAVLGEHEQAVAQIAALRHELFQPLEEPAAFRHGFWLSLAEQYRALGNTAETLMALKQATAVCHTIRDRSQRLRALAQTGTSYVRLGQPATGQAMLEQAVAAATSLEQNQTGGPPVRDADQAMLLTSLAEELASGGLCARARALAEGITLAHNRQDALQRVEARCAPAAAPVDHLQLPPVLVTALQQLEQGAETPAWQAIRAYGEQTGSGGDLLELAEHLAQRGQFTQAHQVAAALISPTLWDDAPSVSSQEIRAATAARIALVYAQQERWPLPQECLFLQSLLSLV